MSPEVPENSTEFTPDEIEIITSFEQEGEFGESTLAKYTDWIDRNESQSTDGKPIGVDAEVSLSLRKARVLQKCGLTEQAHEAANAAYYMILQQADAGELTQEQKYLGNEAGRILDELEEK